MTVIFKLDSLKESNYPMCLLQTTEVEGPIQFFGHLKKRNGEITFVVRTANTMAHFTPAYDEEKGESSLDGKTISFHEQEYQKGKLVEDEDDPKLCF